MSLESSGNSGPESRLARSSVDAKSAQLAENWWVMALRGIFGILFGIIAVLMPGVTIATLVLLFAAYMVADGVCAIIAGVKAARQHGRWGALILEGVADLLAGTIAFFWPLITILAFVFLAGAWAVISGALLTWAAFRLHLDHGRWLMLLGGALSIIWGVLLFFWPITGALVMTLWLAGYALVFGIALLVLAFRLRSRHNFGRPQQMAT
jgi:uncharacterized membrane protein HdeD (DUF308 family)